MQQPKFSLGLVFVDSAGSDHEDGESAPQVPIRHPKFTFPTSIEVRDDESSEDDSMSLESHSEDFT